MSYRDVLKIFKLERELTDDETALLNTLRGMSESEREMLAETVGPVRAVKAAAKFAVKKFKKCDVCGVSKRAAHHRDVNHPDYHVFDEGTPKTTEKKSARASSLASAIKGITSGNNKPAPALCTYSIDGKVCHGSENDGIHDKSLGYLNYHPFVSSSPVPPAPGQSSTNGDEVSSETGSDVVSSVSSATGG